MYTQTTKTLDGIELTVSEYSRDQSGEPPHSVLYHRFPINSDSADAFSESITSVTVYHLPTGDVVDVPANKSDTPMFAVMLHSWSTPRGGGINTGWAVLEGDRIVESNATWRKYGPGITRQIFGSAGASPATFFYAVAARTLPEIISQQLCLEAEENEGRGTSQCFEKEWFQQFVLAPKAEAARLQIQI